MRKPSADAPLHAVVAGATGLTERLLIEQLQHEPSFGSITALARRTMTSDDPRLTWRSVDFENLPSDLISSHIDCCFCCLGTTIKKAGSQEMFRQIDFTYVVGLAEMCAAHHVPHFLLISSVGADSHSAVFYSRVKGEVEQAVASCRIARVSVLRPSMLLGDREEFRIGERVGAFMMRSVNPILIGRFKKYRAIGADTVAKAMVHLATTPGDGYRVYESDEIAELGRAK